MVLSRPGKQILSSSTSSDSRGESCLERMVVDTLLNLRPSEFILMGTAKLHK